MSAVSKRMTLSFPNLTRSFDASKIRVRFWGYDSAIEVSFFMEAGALHKFSPEMSDAEGGVLKAFDDARDQIHEAANRVYMHGHKSCYTYTLCAEDF